MRYRYYVSHAILQNRKAEAGSIARVPAPEIESLVCDGACRHLAAMGEAEPPAALADRELIERHVARVIIKPRALEVCLVPTSEAPAQTEDHGLDDLAPCHPPIPTITLAWIAPSFAAVKGIVHAPCAKPAMRPESRDSLLTAIAKARGWIDDIRLGRVVGFPLRGDQTRRFQCRHFALYIGDFPSPLSRSRFVSFWAGYIALQHLVAI